MKQHLTPLGVFEGLGLTLRVELVALVCRLHGYATHAPIYRSWQAGLQKARKEAPSRASNLQRKLQRVADALNDVAYYLEPFDKDHWGQVLLGLGDDRVPADERVLLPDQFRREAMRLQKMRLVTAAEVEALQMEYGSDDMSVATVRNTLTRELMAFFRERCGLSNEKSNLRTTRIINGVLGGRLPLIEKPEGRDQRHGSETTRSRVRRGQVRKKSR